MRRRLPRRRACASSAADRLERTRISARVLHSPRDHPALGRDGSCTVLDVDDAGMPRWAELRSLASRQHGLVRHAQAVTVGFSSTTISRVAARGQLIRVAPGVLALPGVEVTALHRAAAAVLAHPNAAVTGWSAAWLWGLVRAAPSTVQVVVPATHRGPTTSWVSVRRSRTLVPADVAEVDGIAVVTVARMLVDLAGRTDLPALRRLAIDGRQRRLLTVTELARTAARAGRLPGISVIRRLAAELHDGQSDSPLEHLARTRLVEAGFRPHPTPYPVTVDQATVHLDIAFPQFEVAVEPDGMGFHSTREQLERDQARFNLLQHTSWKILRVSWYDVECRFDRVRAELERLLRSRGWTPE